MPHIIGSFTLSTDRGYKFLPVWDAYVIARSGRLVLWVEGGIAPYTWSVTGTDLVLDTASPATTAVQYNFIEADAAAVIDNVETVTITDANAVSVTIDVCACEIDACCTAGPYYFVFDEISRTGVTAGKCTEVRVLGGCPPFKWELTGTDFEFNRLWTNGRKNTMCAVAAALLTVTTVITVTDACDNEAGQCLAQGGLAALNVSADLLIHSDAANGSTTFTDSGDAGNAPHTLTGYGDHVQHATGQQQFCGSALWNYGVKEATPAPDKSWIDVEGDVSDWAFGTDDFTIGWWMYRDGTFWNGKDVFSAGYRGGGGDSRWLVHVTGYRGASEVQAGGVILYATGDPASGYGFAQSEEILAWHHYALVRHNDELYCYYDGVRLPIIGSSGLTFFHDMATHSVAVGSYMNIMGDEISGHNTRGFMDEIIIMKGTALWVNEFTVQPRPFNCYACAT